ncbi:MAG: MaoC/PaaZ C-terminal domain-containing protein [Acidimicrobiales bacterium]
MAESPDSHLVEFVPVTVEVAEADVIAMMDVMGDINPVHSDHDLVAELGLRGLVNQGPANLAYALNMIVAWAGDPASIRRVDVRFDAITCPGDRLVATGGVTSTTRTGNETIATCAFRLDRDLGNGTTEQILSGTADVLAPQETK